MLDIYIQEEMPDYEIIRVAGDGLCILWTFKEYMEVAKGKEVAMDDIKEKLRKEMSDTFYQILFPLNAKLCVQDEVERFLTHPLGPYDSEICDMFLAALGNDYKANIKIYQLNLKKCWVTDLPDKTKGYEITYFVRCLSAHVGAIVPKSCTTNTPEKVELIKNQVPNHCVLVDFFLQGTHDRGRSWLWPLFVFQVYDPGEENL